MPRNLSNNQGIVFVTVLIMIIISMTLAVSVLSLNISQVKSAEEEVKYIQAKVLADGGLAQVIDHQFSDLADPITYTQTLDGTTFTITADIDVGGPSPGDSESDPLGIDVTF